MTGVFRIRDCPATIFLVGIVGMMFSTQSVDAADLLKNAFIVWIECPDREIAASTRLWSCPGIVSKTSFNGIRSTIRCSPRHTVIFYIFSGF